MDRPIAYDKLAREDRFVRMRARDVAQLKIEQGLPPFPDLGSRESMRGAGARHPGRANCRPWRAPGAPSTISPTRRGSSPWTWPARCGTSPRHLEIYLRLLEHLGGYVGEFPETTILWRCACAEDAAARVAGVNRGLEGLACDVFNQLVHIAGKMGDPILERTVDFVLADEITHVRMGSKWLTKLTEGDPGAPAPGHRVPGDHRRALQPRRGRGRTATTTRCRSPSPRRRGSSAGFTDEEIERLIKTTQRSQVY